jgi:hypothetical protein
MSGPTITIITDVAKKLAIFFALGAGAVALHFATNFLEEEHLPHTIVVMMRSAEIFAFISDLVLFFCFVFVFTVKQAHKLFLEIGVDIPAIVRLIIQRNVRNRP